MDLLWKPTIPSRQAHCTMKLFFIVILQLLLLSARQVVATNNCQMSIWVFDSYNNCVAQQAPNSNAVIYADGQCHTVETDTSINTSNYALLPGTYSAECTSAGKIHFVESSCTDSTCASSSSSSQCDFVNTTVASLYARWGTFAVQSPADSTSGGLYTCGEVTGAEGTAVTIVIFGDCSAPGCIATGTPSAPTHAPVVLTPPPTAAPIVATAAPVVSVNKTTAPSVVGFNRTTAPSTPPVVGVSTTTSVPTTQDMVSDSIPVSITLSPMLAELPTSGLSMWETVTTTQIKESAKSDNVTVIQIHFSGITQSLVSSTQSSSLAVAPGTVRRNLQGGDQSLIIYFVLAMSYSRDSPPPPALSQIFEAAFDTEQERSNYVIDLVPSDPSFSTVRLVAASLADGNGAAPAASPPVVLNGGEPASSSSSRGGDGVIVASVIAGLAVVAVVTGFFVYRNRQSTHVITVDRAADDVSTLGGFVSRGVNSSEGGVLNGGDERTVSTNLDYDYHTGIEPSRNADRVK
jgi:hypothetical protein